jgi:hypothetical protein
LTSSTYFDATAIKLMLNIADADAADDDKIAALGAIADANVSADIFPYLDIIEDTDDDDIAAQLTAAANLYVVYSWRSEPPAAGDERPPHAAYRELMAKIINKLQLLAANGLDGLTVI